VWKTEIAIDTVVQHQNSLLDACSSHFPSENQLLLCLYCTQFLLSEVLIVSLCLLQECGIPIPLFCYLHQEKYMLARDHPPLDLFYPTHLEQRHSSPLSRTRAECPVGEWIRFQQLADPSQLFPHIYNHLHILHAYG
jgi:hypothetical protein